MWFYFMCLFSAELLNQDVSCSKTQAGGFTLRDQWEVWYYVLPVLLIHFQLWEHGSTDRPWLLSVQNLIGRFTIFILLENKRAAWSSAASHCDKATGSVCLQLWTWIYWVTDSGSRSSVPTKKTFLFSRETEESSAQEELNKVNKWRQRRVHCLTERLTLHGLIIQNETKKASYSQTCWIYFKKPHFNLN